MTIPFLIRERLNWLRAQAKGDGLGARLLRSAAGSFALKFANTGLTFATSVFLARALGVDGYGIYAFAMALVALLEVPTQLGMPTLVVRWAAAYEVKKDWARLRGLLRRSGQAVFGFSIVLVALLGAGLWVFGERHPPELVATLAWALALVPLLALGALREAALRGLHHVVLGQLPEMLARPLVFLLLLGLAYWLQGTLTPSWAAALQVYAVGVAFALGAWWLWQRLPTPLKAVSPAYETSDWARSALPLMLMGGMYVVNSHVDLLMLGLLRGAEDVGLYRVAIQGASLVVFGVYVINAAIAPTLSRLHAEQARQRLQEVATWSAQAACFLFGLPVALLLIVFGGTLLETIFGQEFAGGHLPLAILCVGQLVIAAGAPALPLLEMTGHERDAARVTALATALNVPLNLLLIPLFGAPGAAAATVVVLVMRNILLTVRVYRQLGIWSVAFVIPRLGRAKA